MNSINVFRSMLFSARWLVSCSSRAVVYLHVLCLTIYLFTCERLGEKSNPNLTHGFIWLLFFGRAIFFSMGLSQSCKIGFKGLHFILQPLELKFFCPALLLTRILSQGLFFIFFLTVTSTYFPKHFLIRYLVFQIDSLRNIIHKCFKNFCRCSNKNHKDLYHPLAALECVTRS